MEPKENRLCSNCKHYAGKDQIFGPCDKHEVTIVARNASCPCWRPVTILRNDCENDENAAWELAQRIRRKETEGGMTLRDLYDCFGSKSISDIFNLSYKEAREKYITWCKKKEDEIHVGDEVETLEGTYIKMVATKVTENTVSGVSFDGQVHARFISKVKKTGRRYSLIVDLLKDWASLDEWTK